MATFQVRVEDLIGSVGDTQLITDSLTDSAAEIISVLPKECLWVVSTSSGDVTAVKLNIEKCLILSVIRENGTDGEYEDCKPVPLSYFRRVQDVNSMWHPSTSEPVYVLKNSHVFVYPAPGVSPNAFQVDYVTNPSVAFGASSITGFPDEYEYVVVVGATMKCLQRIMVNNIASITAVPPDVPALPAISYANASVGDAITAAVDSIVVAQDSIAAAQDSITVAQDSITVGPTDAAGVTDTEAPQDAAGVSDSDAPSDAAGSGAAYTKPVVQDSTGASGSLTSLLTGGVAGDATDQLQFDTWWELLGDMIEDDEDIELANAQVSKIRTYISAFQAEVQNASAAMQATIEDARQSTQASIATAGDATRASIANAANDVSTNNASMSSLTQASIANASNDVSTNNASMSSLTQASVANASNDVNASIAKMRESTGAATAKMQQSTSAATSKMQQSTSAATTKMQLSTQASIEKMRQSTSVNVQNASQTLEATMQDYRMTLNRFSEEVKEYSAEVAKELQEQTLKFQQHTRMYDQLQSDYARGLKVITGRFSQYKQPQRAES